MSDLTRKLPDWIEAFLHYTDNTEPPFLYRKWTAIACIASALQRKCKIEWGTALTFYPNFYIVLVGPSATGKGIAMSAGLQILREVPSVKLSAQATSLQALIRHLKNTNLTDVDMKTGDQTYHSSMTIFSKEFTVFLGYHNKELMASLCDWFDCDDRWAYETISRKREEIIGVWVNLIGGTTPDLIRSALPIEAIGGGLTSRIIFVVEENKGKLVTLPMQSNSERELMECLVHDLERISLLSGQFSCTEGFLDFWHEWCVEAEKNPPFYDKKFDGYLGRRRTHVMKLAMIANVSRGDNEMILKRDDLEWAIATLEEVEVKMGTVFKGVGRSDIAGLIHDATRFIVSSASDEIPYFHFARHFGGDMDKFMMDRVLRTLEVSNMIQVINRPGGESYIKRLKIEDRLNNKQSEGGEDVQD
jgi:hypothetical protein